jgi:MtN3 and saliva related transmembrane protein
MLKEKMDRSLIEALGFVAGALTTFAFAPQLLQTWKTGGKDLSWSMLSMFGLGVSLWIVYGVLLEMMPIIVANGLTIVQIAAIVLIKWMRAQQPPAQQTSSQQSYD